MSDATRRLTRLGNPLGENRTSYPDAELKKTIAANLTAAKAQFPTCKNGYWSLDFGSLSELVVNNSKLERRFDSLTEGTNDDITTAHCYVEVSFVYQHHYNFTFGAVSIDNRPLHDACHDSEPKWTENVSASKCVPLNSTAGDEHQRFACCCRRIWSQPKEVCHKIVFDQLKTLLDENVIAETPAKIMGELEKDTLTKCDDEESSDEVQAGNALNRPCSRNDGCYTGVHARDVPRNTQHKEFYGCVSEYAPDAKKRDDDKASNEVEARFSRICRLARDQDQCFAVLGTEDTELPADVRGPQMVCCCDGHLDTAKKCGTSHKFGMKIGDFDL
ncbi:hypothetical protein AAVH_38157 [Aphelenchoides avenae]|nr:hypothetical protein AAVH_38157 [Aphelenchus avenae]